MMKSTRLSILVAILVLALAIFTAIGLIYHNSMPQGPTGQAGAVERSKEARLRISLKVHQARLLYQQDTYCAVTLENTGSRPVEVSIPPLDKTMPIVHVVNVRTGEVGVHQRVLPRRAVRHEPGRLGLGEVAQSGFKLLDVVPALEQGDYDIRVVWEYDRGAGKAESEAVRVQILPTIPKRLILANAYGGRGALKFGVWVNLAEVPNASASIVRSRFALKRGGGVNHFLLVAPCSSSCRPTLSAPAVGTVLGGQWVAWIDGKTLYYTHVDDELGAVPIQSRGLPGEGFEIVLPLYSTAVVDTTVRPPGAILLCQGAADASQFRLHAVDLATEQSRSLGVAALPGPKPAWIMSHALADGKRLVTYAQSVGETVLLHLAPWPASSTAPVSPTRLAAWEGMFLAGGATIDSKDTIRGGTLILGKDEKGKGRLQLVAWSVSRDNAIQEVRRHGIDWSSARVVREARIAVGDDGKTGALISDDQGSWYVYDGDGHLVPAPEEIRRTKLALELGFLNGIGEPLLIAGREFRGFQIMRLDGSLLPPRQVPK